MSMLETMSNRRRAQSILRQLKDERVLLLQGRIEDLVPLIPRLNKLTDELESMEGSDDPKFIALISEVRNAAHRNKGLIKASKKGLEAARQKLHQIEASQTQLNTYTGAGERKEISASNSTQEKRS